MFLLVSAMAVAFAATASDLYTAMAVPSADVSLSGVSGGTSAYDTISSLGILTPTEGSDMAILHTGQIGSSPQTGYDHAPYGASGDESALTLELNVPSTANSFTVDFYFLSAEYPEFVGSVYNDAFEMYVSGSAFTGNAAIDSTGSDITINSALFSVTDPADLSGTSFEGVGGGTGWLTVVVPVDPSTSVTVNMSVYDVYDGIYDSAVLLDNFEWDTSDPDEPSIAEPIDIDYLSPKRGSVDGGETTVVYGEGYSEECVAYFDGVEAPTTFIDVTRVSAIPEPHDEGLVDVEVNCAGSDITLVGGYTYYDEESGSIPPLILSVDPYAINVDGGELVTITGEDFEDAPTLTLDGSGVEVIWIDSETLEFTAPAHDEGSVDVEVVNPDGLLDMKSGGLFYISASSWDPETGSDDDRGDDEDDSEESVDGDGAEDDGSKSGCSQAPTSVSWMVLLGMCMTLVGRRER